MKILFNENEVTVYENTRLFAFLQSKKISTEYVIVELNGRILSSKEIETTLLREGDCLEVMALVGGG